MLLGGAMFAKAQSSTVIVGDPVNMAYTATKVSQTSDGFELEGNITSRAATAKELEIGSDGGGGTGMTVGCGFWGNWVCGHPTVVTDPNYPITWIKCEGSTGKCAKVTSK